MPVLATSIVTSVPTAAIPLQASESENPTTVIKVHQAVEFSVETDVKYICYRNSIIENLVEIEFFKYNLRELERAEEDSICEMLIWADVLEVEPDARKHSK